MLLVYPLVCALLPDELVQGVATLLSQIF
jgi:hypothetical protein